MLSVPGSVISVSNAIRFPDSEDVWINYLNERLDIPVGSRLFEAPRFVRVLRAGGNRQNIVLDMPQMVFDVYGEDEFVAAGLAADVRAIVLAAEGTFLAPGVKAKRFRDVTGPSNVPDDEHPSSRYSFTVMTALSGVLVDSDTLKGNS